jgi:hypothetical protein
MYRASMHNGIMADADIITNIGGVFQVSTMDAGAILYVYLVAKFDVMHIAAHNGIEPKTALVAGGYIANYSGIGGDKAICAELRGFSFYGEDDGHNFTNLKRLVLE